MMIGTAHAAKTKAEAPPPATAHLLRPGRNINAEAMVTEASALWQGDVLAFLKALPREPLFDLIATSPPYNIGKEYETKQGLEAYLEWQATIIDELIPRLRDGGSLCWQVGNFVVDNQIFPLDIEFAPIFKKHKLQMRNRIIWTFGHGLHTQRRFSGRYEVVLWYTKTESRKDAYTFNLDEVRVPSKYPGKKHFKGPNAGQLSGNPQMSGMIPLEGNNLLQSIQSGWLGWPEARKVPSYCAYETLPTFGLDIVSMSSATALCNQDLDPITANHIDIVKPRDVSQTALRQRRRSGQRSGLSLRSVDGGQRTWAGRNR